MKRLFPRSKTSSSPSMNGTVSLPSSANVKVVVGSEKVEHILPEDTLAPAPGLLRLLAASGTSMRAVELSNDDPAIVECILRWLLKHGQIAGIPFDLNINVRQKSETRHALELIQLYACAVKYNVEGLAYDIVFAEKEFARPTLTGANWSVYCSGNPDLEAEIRSFDPVDTIDLFRHCSMAHGSHLFPYSNKTAYKDRCIWHRHTFTKACDSLFLRDMFKFKPNLQPPVTLVINRPQLTAKATPETSSGSETTGRNNFASAPPLYQPPAS